MEITFPEEAPYFDTRRDSVIFPARVDGVRRNVIVPRTYLEDNFCAKSYSDFVAVVESHRAAIEHAACKKIENRAAGDVILGS